MGDTGQVKYHLHIRKRGRIGCMHRQVQCLGRCSIGLRRTRLAQRDNRVTLVSQLLAKLAPDESGRASNKASHSIQGLLTLFELVTAMKKGAEAPHDTDAVALFQCY
jgi:hypothetical protein